MNLDNDTMRRDFEHQIYKECDAEEAGRNSCSSEPACSVNDCSECWSACVEFSHPFLHLDGHPFCMKGRPVTVLKLVQSERIQPGCMKPNGSKAE
jgi:hypothetical protein